MKYLDAIKGSAIAFVIFILAVIFLPTPQIKGVDIILTISTFLFAIVAGFCISRLGSRYDRIRDLIADEDAYFLTFYRTARIYGEEFYHKIIEIIDGYYIRCYDFTLSHYDYRGTAIHFFKLWDEIEKMKKYRNESAYQNLLTNLTSIENCRNSANVIASEALSVGQWTILIFLTGIILFSMFCFRTNSFYSQIITILFSTSLILVLLIIRDLQNLMYGGKALLEDSGQENLEFMGKLRYYNQIHIKSGVSRIPSYVKEYRLGLHKPGSKEVKIKIVQNK